MDKYTSEQSLIDEMLAPVREGEEIDRAFGREIPPEMIVGGRHKRERYWEKRLAEGRAKYGDGVWFGVEEGNITIMRTRRSNFKAGRTTHPDGIWECLVIRDEPRLPHEKGILVYRYLGEGTMPVPATDEFFEFYKLKDPRCVLNDVVYRDVPVVPAPESLQVVEEEVVVPEEAQGVAEPENVVEAPGIEQGVAPMDYVAEPLTPETPLTTEEFLAKFPLPEPALETVPPEPMLPPDGYEVVDLSPQVTSEVEPEPEYDPPIEVSSGLLTPEQLAEIQARYVPVDDGTEIDLLPPFGGSPTVYEATPPAPVHTNSEGRNVIPGLEDLL